MQIHQRIASFRESLDEARHHGKRVGLVPTMGALHEGHLSLVEAAQRDADTVAVTIFVNPLQFRPGEDFQGYPRDFERDAELLRGAGVDHVLAPSVEEMYPGGSLRTSVSVNVGVGLMEDAHRPGHFDGVATAVNKLFAVAGTCHAYFGEKDWQQLTVIRTMAKDLSIPVEVVGCPTVRETDGLAKSSRNMYLNDQQRRVAVALHAGLRAGANAFASGESNPARLAEITKRPIREQPTVELHYAQLAGPDLQVPARAEKGHRLLVAATVGGAARLIDNVELT